MKASLHEALTRLPGAPHHFENFTKDFVTWVVFYGPQVGE